MKRTFNYTGRKSIPKGTVSIRLHDADAIGSVQRFTVQFVDLDTLALPATATIYVEPYVGGSSSMRFPFGTVGQPVAPATTTLDEIDAGGKVLFRVKIVDESEAVGRLLASVDEVAPRDESDTDGRKPLLPLRRLDLGEELWRVSISVSDGPELLVNNRIPDLADRIKVDPTLQGLVLPHALRCIVPELFEEPDGGDWHSNWREFVTRIFAEDIDWELDPTDEPEVLRDLVETVVRRFVDKQRYAGRILVANEASDD